MADLTRRAFLRAMPAAAAVASVAVAMPAIAAQVEPTAPDAGEIVAMYGDLSSHQRALAQRALREEDLTNIADALEARFPSQVQWSGDARYALIEGKTRPVYWISRAPEYDDGERWFKLSTGFSGPLEPKDWYCRESELPLLAYRLPEYSLQVGGAGRSVVRRGT